MRGKGRETRGKLKRFASCVSRPFVPVVACVLSLFSFLFLFFFLSLTEYLLSLSVYTSVKQKELTDLTLIHPLLSFFILRLCLFLLPSSRSVLIVKFNYREALASRTEKRVSGSKQRGKTPEQKTVYLIPLLHVDPDAQTKCRE